MVRDRLGIGRADTDIDQGDTASARRLEVIGRHLETPPGRPLDKGMRVRRRGIHGDVSGRGEALVVIVLLQLADGPGREGVDIAVIIGEEDKLLRILVGRAGIVAQPLQRIIDPRRLEQGERLDRARFGRAQPVGQIIIDAREVGIGKVADELGRRGRIHVQFLGPVQHVGEGEFRIRWTGLDGDLIAFREQGELLDQIIPEQGRMRDRGGVEAGIGKLAEGAADRRRRTVRRIGHPELGIDEGTGLPVFGRWRRSAIKEGFQSVLQTFNGQAIERIELFHRFSGRSRDLVFFHRASLARFRGRDKAQTGKMSDIPALPKCIIGLPARSL